MQCALLRLSVVAAAVLSVLMLTQAGVWAQTSSFAGTGPPVSKDEPVTFTADEVEYDRDSNLVTARGHIEVWQAGRIVRADQVSFNRQTGVVVAIGNVVLMQPDGQVLFAKYAELNRDMSEGIMQTVRALLANNGRLAANGMRRTGGLLNEL